MNKPLKEHYEVETDAGIMYRIFDYAKDLEEYIKYLEKAINYTRCYANLKDDLKDGGTSYNDL